MLPSRQEGSSIPQCWTDTSIPGWDSLGAAWCWFHSRLLPPAERGLCCTLGAVLSPHGSSQGAFPEGKQRMRRVSDPGHSQGCSCCWKGSCRAPQHSPKPLEPPVGFVPAEQGLGLLCPFPEPCHGNVPVPGGAAWCPWVWRWHWPGQDGAGGWGFTPVSALVPFHGSTLGLGCFSSVSF